MRRKAFPYYVLIGIALILLFIVSCGSQDGGAPVAGSGDPAGIGLQQRGPVADEDLYGIAA